MQHFLLSHWASHQQIEQLERWQLDAFESTYIECIEEENQPFKDDKERTIQKLTSSNDLMADSSTLLVDPSLAR